MTRAKGRQQTKLVAVKQYTKQSGTAVQSHARLVNPRFEPVYRNPYFSEGCIHGDDPLVETLECSTVVIDYDQAVDSCAAMNALYAAGDTEGLVKYLMDTHQMTRKDARNVADWSPTPMRTKLHAK